jgi:succinylglutamic semialdehyde dehydrogenase
MSFKFEIKSLGDYIDGSFRNPELPSGYLTDVSPADLNDQIMKVPYWYSHVEESCRAAKLAYPKWARLSLAERTEYLLRLKELFIVNEARMAECISRDVGKPLWESLTEAKALSQKIDVTLQHSMKLVAEERITNALPGVDGVIRYKARGLMAVIGPFNFPAHLPNGHIIPALAMGNTVVFKPSEQAPAVGQLYAEIFQQAGFPRGVFNLIQGDAESGKKLVVSEDVDGILFTGSYDVGLRIKQETLTHYWKILALEMGGKNATVVWSDADIDKAVYETLIGAFLTAGQRCSCTSRIILHEKIANEFTDRFYQAAKQISIGHWQENVFMGPLINATAVEKYLRFQEIAKREGCESLMRGKALDLKTKGF